MGKRILFFLLLAGCSFITKSQTLSSAKGNIYAVIVGISQYQNPTIPQLNYADKDATVFADWLKSKAGGSVPDYRIRLLTNTEATVAAIYYALDWLSDEAQANDIVYLYFSGHGDVEIDSSSIGRGYLLAYNSPPNNYANNAIRIEDVNSKANSLTIKNQAKVILITDACHSGKLAGDNYKGKQLTAHNLRAVLNNQIRIASCAEDEEAAEGPAWGGGRGVFSYYLLNGLNGMADLQKNDTIKLNELGIYLDSALLTDKDLVREKHKQHPVTDGLGIFPLAVVNKETLLAIKNKGPVVQMVNTNPPAGLQSLKSLGPQPLDYFSSVLSNPKVEEVMAYGSYLNKPIAEVPLYMLNNLLLPQQAIKKSIDSLHEIVTKAWEFQKENWQLMQPFLNNDTSEFKRQLDAKNDSILTLAQKNSDLEISGKNSLLDVDLNQIENLRNQVMTNRAMAARLSERFVLQVHNDAQDMINAYISGDLAEIEKRQYYTSGKRIYDVLLARMILAEKMVPKQSYMANIFAIQRRYLQGLMLRLKMETSKTDNVTLNKAIALQQEALALDPYAPYVNNEIGNLYTQKKMFDSAEYHFTLATILAPTWAIPWSNKINLYLSQNNLVEAKEAIEKAKSLQPDLAFIKVNAGLVMEKENNLLAAEEYYLAAIAQNNFHYLPFERLGYLYMQTGEIGKADYYFYEADRRKAGYNINDELFTEGIMLNIHEKDFPNEYCSNTVAVNSLTLPFIKLEKALRILNEYKVDTASAIQNFKEALAVYPELPLANHYLGKILYKQGKWKEAKDALQKAVSIYRPKNELINYLYNLNILKDTTGSINCFAERLIDFEYDYLEDHYLLGRIAEKTGMMDEAAKNFDLIRIEENRRLIEKSAFAGYAPPRWTEADLIRVAHDTDYLNDKFNESFIANPVASGYIFLSSLYEKQGEYDKAEKILLNQMEVTRKAADSRQEAIDKNKPRPSDSYNEDNKYYWYIISNGIETVTSGFYSRMLALNPLNPDPAWKEKTAIFLYDRLALSYNQVPIKERQLFYKAFMQFADYIAGVTKYTRYSFCQSMAAYGYPWLYNSNEIMGDSSISISIPGAEKYLSIKIPDFEPVQKARELMEQAVKLSGDIVPRRELLEPLADLYYWTGDTVKTIASYTGLVSRFPDDDSLRNKLIEIYVFANQLTEARNHLDTLFQKGKIRNDQIHQLAGYNMLSGDYKKATAVINNFKPIKTENEKMLNSFYGSLYWLQNEPAKALDYYLKSVPDMPGPFKDWSGKIIPDENDNRYAPLYSIARIYAVLNKDKKALIEVKKMLDLGFSYSNVLEKDKAWDKLKKSENWKLLLNKYKLGINYVQKKEDKINNSHWFRIPTETFYIR